MDRSSPHSKFFFAFAFAVLGTLFLPATCRAELVIDVLEVGNDVVARFDGQLNLDGLSSSGSFASGGINSSGIFSGTSSTVATDLYSGLTSYPEGRRGTGWGATVTTRQATTATGDFGIGVQTLSFGVRGRFWVPDGYSSGSPLEATMTWENQTLDSLLLNRGTYVWEWDADRIVVNIAPEPTTSAIALAGICLILVRLCHR